MGGLGAEGLVSNMVGKCQHQCCSFACCSLHTVLAPKGREVDGDNAMA